MSEQVKEVIALSSTLWRLEDKFGVNHHKIHILRILAEAWESEYRRFTRVTDVLDFYSWASRAVTHRMVRELVSSKILKEIPSKEDKRVKFLQPGPKFEAYAKAIGE
jgi:DNA-binding MarR family transcriptional regulator